MGNFAQEGGEGVDVCQRDGERWGEVLKSPQGVYSAGFQDFIRLIGLLLMEILVGYPGLHNYQVHLSSSAESLFILLNNDFNLRFRRWCCRNRYVLFQTRLPFNTFWIGNKRKPQAR